MPTADRRVRRGAYLLPTLFTFLNILLGFCAVILGLGAEFPRAAWLIFAAAFVDGLDGRVARLTGVQSSFGRELDSLADVVTFGVGPALLSYLWGLERFGRIGWLVPLFYLLCASVRLARFNVQTATKDTRYFVGLPTPAAGVAIASILYFLAEPRDSAWWPVMLGVALLLLGLLMVSTFRYRSFKEFALRRRWSYRAAILVAGLALIVLYHPPAFLLVLAIGYAISGPFSWLVVAASRHRKEPSPRQESQS